MEWLEGLLALVAGILLGVFGLLGVKRLNPWDKKYMTKEEYEKKVRDKEDELKKKPALHIVNDLDNTDDVESVKHESDNEFDGKLDEHRKRKRERKRDIVDGF